MHRFAGFRNLVAMVTFHPAARMNSMTEGDGLDRRGRRWGSCRGFASGPSRHSPGYSLQSHLCFESPLCGTGFSLGEKRICCEHRRRRSARAETYGWPDGDHHKLLPRFLPQIRQWGCIPVSFKFSNPKLLTCLRVERPKTAIGSGADENQSTGGYYRAPEVVDSGLGDSFRFQRVNYSQRHSPGNVSGIQIHCVHSPPRRLLAGILMVIPKARIAAPLASPYIGLGRAGRLWFHLAHGP